jgi:tetrahydromethanopterin S-methyltransferase subunit H
MEASSYPVEKTIKNSYLEWDWYREKEKTKSKTANKIAKHIRKLVLTVA